MLDLATIAGSQLLEALDSESRGIPKNANVRRYLQSLPQGITQQNYWLHQNGTVLKHVSFGEALLPELPLDVPYIAQYLGNIIGVGFEPGRPEVKIKSESGNATLVATSEQVDTALRLRSSTVNAVAVVHGDTLPRLLILQDAEVPLNRSTRKAAIYECWQVALKRLAE